MAVATPNKNSVARAKAPLPTAGEADLLAGQVNALLNIDGHLHNVIADDVRLGTVDSPFAHPLYAVRIKLDGIRGKKAKRLGAYARSLKPKRAQKGA